MKIIALMPVKNAAWSLPAYISSVTKIADEIIVVEDGSNDGTNELLEKAGAKIYTLPPYTKTMTSHSEHRNFLLQKGREAGGTHFIWIDSDEAFTAPFISNAKQLIGNLKPGQKLAMRWLTLWKSAYRYRDDSSVWSNLYKEFITCDTPEYSFGKQLFHESRTPGPTTKENTIRLPVDKGAVLHFQSAAWEAYQIKQAFYRCSELRNYPKEILRINLRYSITMDDPSAKTTEVPKEWLEGIKIPVGIESTPAGWQLDQIFSWFDENGVEFFEPLEIWHIPELRAEFKKRTGRDPKSNWISPHIKFASILKWRIKKILERQ